VVKKLKKSLFTGIPAWALSLMSFFAMFMLAFVLEFEISAIEVIYWIFYVLFLNIACFLICRKYPKSVWYTPFIYNGISILFILVYIFTDYENTTELILAISLLVLSLIVAIIGSSIGQRPTNQAKYLI
jgi:hypothetical protein